MKKVRRFDENFMNKSHLKNWENKILLFQEHRKTIQIVNEPYSTHMTQCTLFCFALFNCLVISSHLFYTLCIIFYPTKHPISSFEIIQFDLILHFAICFILNLPLLLPYRYYDSLIVSSASSAIYYTVYQLYQY